MRFDQISVCSAISKASSTSMPRYRTVDSNLCTEVYKLESTVRYLGIEVDDALEISEQTEI